MAGGAAVAGNFAADNAKPNARAFIAIAIAMLGSAMFGADQANWGTVASIKSFEDHWCQIVLGEDFDCDTLPTNKPAAWQTFHDWGGQALVLAMLAGAVLPGPLIAKHQGRRLAVSLGTFTCFIGCVLASYLCAKNLVLFYIGRVLIGFGCGMTCYALPMYNAEVSTTNVRGATGNLFQFMCQFGVFLAPIILSPQLGLQDWKLGIMLPGMLGLPVSILVWFCPESPSWVLKKHGAERARAVLQACREGDVSEELEMMEKALQYEREAGQVPYMELFTKPGLRKRVFIACYLQVAQQMTGINGINNNQGDLFAAAGYTGDVTSIPTGPSFIYGAVQIVSCVVGISIVEKVGRKPMVLWSSVVMGPALLLMALLVNLNKLMVIVEVGIFVFGFCFAGFWGATPWTYPSEIFTQTERERALSVSTGVQFFMNFVSLYIFNWVNSYSTWIVFLVFGLFNFSNIIFVATLIKETKGVPLEDMIQLFDGTSKDEGKAPLV